jgi:hypothetical protein
LTDDRIWRVRTGGPGSFAGAGWYPSLMERQSGLHELARVALDVDTKHIVSCIETRLHLVEGRPLSGLVLGAVQSGKTASMLSVSALAIDRGFNVIVIVSGTRVSLWRQTFNRAIRDLDGWSRSVDFKRRQARILMPSADSSEAGLLSPGTMFGESTNRMARCLEEGRPLIAVVMKQADHLLALTGALQRSIRAADRPVKMLVIDDEADDGSILSRPDPGSFGDPPLAKRIEGLWATGPSNGGIFHNQLRVVYLAYTATPQANLLQHDHNPLSPRHFVTCIRSPGIEGAAADRDSASYQVPTLFARHTGGGHFYPPPSALFTPCVPLASAQGLSQAEWDAARLEHLGNALRSFIVASACRLLESGKTYVASRGSSFTSRREALERMPPISSMLFNPGSQVESHFDGECLIRCWVHGESVLSASSRAETHGLERPEIDWTRLTSRIKNERDCWRAWLAEFRRSSEVLRLQPGCSGVVVPTDDWESVERVIVEEILPSICVQVVNSSDAADSAPDFSPRETDGSGWTFPESLCSVFVAGNVMSRGLTLEGLSTTLFLRDPEAPLADTQMQMQRWFGYRGRWFQYCRVFAFEDQISRFRQYNAADEALRAEILAIERQSAGGVSPQVLGGRSFMPTGKVENIRQLPLAPSAAPFVSNYWERRGPDPNLELVQRLFLPGQYEGVEAGRLPRGLILKRKLTLMEVADFLDGFRYAGHDPRPSAEQHARWSSLERTVLRQDVPPTFFRPGLPLDSRNRESRDAFPHTRCPYSIAAYLRLWQVCVDQGAPGLFPNDRPNCLWSHLSVDERRRRCPRFAIGIRFGRGDTLTGTCLDEIGAELGESWRIRSMERETDDARSQLVGTWGSRNPSDRSEASYLGDQFFDYHRTGETRAPRSTNIDDTPWRAIGEDGLVLFHPILSGHGEIRLAVGFCLPAGGPDQIGILRPLAN